MIHNSPHRLHISYTQTRLIYPNRQTRSPSRSPNNKSPEADAQTMPIAIWTSLYEIQLYIMRFRFAKISMINTYIMRNSFLGFVHERTEEEHEAIHLSLIEIHLFNVRSLVQKGNHQHARERDEDLDGPLLLLRRTSFLLI